MMEDNEEDDIEPELDIACRIQECRSSICPMSDHETANGDEGCEASNINCARLDLSSNEINDLNLLKKEILNLSSLLSERDSKFHQLSKRLNEFEDEACRQRRLNEVLSNKVCQLRDELSSNVAEYDKEIAKLDKEKQVQRDGYVKDLVDMNKEIESLKDKINVKEELVIPGLLHELENKNALLHRTLENLTTTTEKVDRFANEVAVLTEERDSLVSELQRNSTEHGNAINEVYEVLRLRDKMAKDFVAYRVQSEKTITNLEEDLRLKDGLNKELLVQVKSSKTHEMSVIEDNINNNRKLSTSSIRESLVSTAMLSSWRKPLLVLGGSTSLISAVLVGLKYSEAKIDV